MLTSTRTLFQQAYLLCKVQRHSAACTLSGMARTRSATKAGASGKAAIHAANQVAPAFPEAVVAVKRQQKGRRDRPKASSAVIGANAVANAAGATVVTAVKRPTKKRRVAAAAVAQEAPVEQKVQEATEEQKAPPASIAKPRRRRAKQAEPITLKTEYDVELATTAEENDTVAPSTKEKVVRRRAPVLIKGPTEISDDLLARLPPSAKRKFVGCHVSIAGGIERAVINAASLGARAFALDTRNKQRWESPPLSPETATAFREALVKFSLSPRHILPHGSYLINLGSADDVIAGKSFQGFVTELKRCEELGLEMYNFHPGSTSGLCTPQESLDRIATCINEAHAQTRGVTVVLENMAGSGNSVGHTFENLRHIIEGVRDQSRVGVCLDTCHLYAAGFDVATEEGYEHTMRSFDEVVGLQYLRALHVNDSKGALASRRDRHENIGRGLIGLPCFERLMNDPRLDGLPLIMETPMQCAGPKLNYPVSVRDGCVAFQETEDEAGVCTDKRDIELLYTLCK